jgi:RNA polymerase sigma-70 factor, ECF subfamily
MVGTDRYVQLAAQGDVAAFEEIYRSHHRRVFNQCLRMTRNASEAEDLTQDVFLQLYRKLKTFRGESAFTTWLHRLTMNVVLMHFRKTSVRPDQRSDRIPEQLELASRGAGSESSVILNRIYLDEALRQLSPGYRAVLILHDVEGYEHNQIGEILGCAVGTSKSQLHKARKRLRRLLKKRAAQGAHAGQLQLRYV